MGKRVHNRAAKKAKQQEIEPAFQDEFDTPAIDESMWKSIDIDHNQFGADSGFGGLEVLTEYSLDKDATTARGFSLRMAPKKGKQAQPETKHIIKPTEGTSIAGESDRFSADTATGRTNGHDRAVGKKKGGFKVESIGDSVETKRTESVKGTKGVKEVGAAVLAKRRKQLEDRKAIQLKKKAEKKAKRDEINDALALSKAEADVAAQAIIDSADVSEWEPYHLHSQIIQGIARNGFKKPTPIQVECLDAAIVKGNDVMGAAETGSGKTLAFGIPMLNWIFNVVLGSANTSCEGTLHLPSENVIQDIRTKRPLLGLVICPTRELAMQVKDHLSSLTKGTKVKVVAIVGGIAPEKQERQLGYKPEVVVATPGRFWELMRTSNAHLNALEYLKFMVVDEADRLVEKNHYAELFHILGRLPQYEESSEYSGVEASQTGDDMGVQDEEKDGEGDDEMEGVDVEVVDGSDGAVRETGGEGGGGESDADYTEPLNEGEFEVQEEWDGEVEDIDTTEADFDPLDPSNWENQSVTKCPYVRQNLVFSATLTVDTSKFMRAAGMVVPTNKKKKDDKEHTVMVKLQERLGLREAHTSVVDLSRGLGLASALSEGCITCLEDEKDVYLFYFLQRFPGRTLVFVNSIDCIRHVTPILSQLGCKPLGLHANMQQRQRLKNLERFRTLDRSVLVATDVAARGLDIKGVQHVIHYQLPRTVELYVHRSGRTARADAGGVSVVLLSPNEIAKYKKLCKSIDDKKGGFSEFPVDSMYMPAIKARVSLARRVDKIQHRLNKKKGDDDFFEKAAREMDIILDDSLVSTTDDTQSRKIRRERAELDSMKAELSALLQVPILPQSMNTKYLTGGEKSGDIVDQLTLLKADANSGGILMSNNEKEDSLSSAVAAISDKRRVKGAAANNSRRKRQRKS